MTEDQNPRGGELKSPIAGAKPQEEEMAPRKLVGYYTSPREADGEPPPKLDRTAVMRRANFDDITGQLKFGQRAD